MVTMTRGSNWKISVYGREHGIPHFHVEGPGFRASVGIESLEMIVGSVPPKIFDQAIGWASENKVMLMTKWKELNP